MITILLATYNGQKYLPEQLDSIFAQTVKDFRVIISDDGSTDDTLAVIDDFKTRYPGQITLLPKRDGGHPGPMGNFAHLLNNCPSSDYIFFSDQDDFWLPEKIALTLEKFSSLEGTYGHSHPLLVHSAYQLADSNLLPLKEGLTSLTGIRKAAANHLGTLLQQNVVTGCTMAINRPLFELLRPVPAAAIMHDWWLALLAAAFGKIGFTAKPTMKYRQHGNNNVGGNYRLSAAKIFDLPKKFSRDLHNRQQQAAAFLEQYQDILSPEQQLVLIDFIDLGQLGTCARLKKLNSSRLWTTSRLKNLEIILLLPWV